MLFIGKSYESETLRESNIGGQSEGAGEDMVGLSSRRVALGRSEGGGMRFWFRALYEIPSSWKQKVNLTIYLLALIIYI